MNNYGNEDKDKGACLPIIAAGGILFAMIVGYAILHYFGVM